MIPLSKNTFLEAPSLPLVIPTGAYPNFLLRRIARTTGAALRKESRMQIIKATGLDRKFGGAQWRDLRFLFLPLKGKRDQERFLISFADDPTALVNLEENDDQREQGE
jgi:hypothetical protein